MLEKIKKINERAQTLEQKSEDWPSDYFECLKPVYQISEEESDKKSEQHLKNFEDNHNLKECVTFLLINARSELKEKFGFTELTLLEIKSLVDIAKNLTKQFSDEKSIKDFFDFRKGFNKFSVRNEVVDNWLIENYGIYSGSYGAISGQLFDEERRRGVDLSQAINHHKDSSELFIDYVRKVRDRALLVNKK